MERVWAAWNTPRESEAMRNGHQKKVQKILEHAPASTDKRCSPGRSRKLNLSGAALPGTLREWIDRVIVPALLQDYIRESQQKPYSRLSVVHPSGASTGQSDEVAK
jgi:hypothetical protein